MKKVEITMICPESRVRVALFAGEAIRFERYLRRINKGKTGVREAMIETLNAALTLSEKDKDEALMSLNDFRELVENGDEE